MKGTLQKVESGWEVWYAKPRTDNQNGFYLGRLPIHPEDSAGIFIKDTDHLFEGKEVEFEESEEFMPYDNFNPVHKYAKLIK